MVNKSTMNIGFCISESLKDYAVNINPSICFLLSNPLWLGLNNAENNEFIPIDKGYISFVNPLFLEHFSVNANCLFIPVRGNAKEHYDLILSRLKNKKKVLVKISDRIFDENFSQKIKTFKPFLSLIYEIEVSEKEANLVKLHHTESKEMVISKDDFMQYWNYEKQERINAEWFAIIPSKAKLSEELLIKKLKNAFIKQVYHLQPNSGKLITGYAVLEYLKNSLKQGIGKYSTSKQHQILWETSCHITNDYSSSRLQYANSLIDIQEFWEEDLGNLISVFLDASKIWNTFLNNANNMTLNKDYLLEQYNNLIIVEKNILYKLNQLIS